jgi:hypothetical protein
MHSKITIGIFAVSLFAFAPSLQAQVIIFDDFSIPNSDTGSHSPYNIFGTPINGLGTSNGSTPGTVNPGTDLPGGTWIRVGGGGDSDAQEVGKPGPSGNPGTLTLTGTSTNVSYASMVHNGAAVLSLGSYNTGDLSVSAAISPLDVFNEAGGSTYLGFKASSTSGLSNFNGLSLDSSGGLSLVLNGVVQPDTVAFSGGTFVASTASLLTFTLDASTGALTGISLQGSSADYSSLLGGTSFTTANTGFIALSASAQGGRYADLTVEATPEPSTYALFILSALFIGACALRRNVRA